MEAAPPHVGDLEHGGFEGTTAASCCERASPAHVPHVRRTNVAAGPPTQNRLESAVFGVRSFLAGPGVSGVVVMFQCRDWSTPPAHVATTEAASPNEEHLRDLMTRKIPWLDAQLEEPHDLSLSAASSPPSGGDTVELKKPQDLSAWPSLAMMNPMGDEVLKECRKTLRAAKLKHIEGVALMTPARRNAAAASPWREP